MARACRLPLDMISLDRKAASPLHRQLYDSLRAHILDGKIPSNTRLPATRELANDLGSVLAKRIGKAEAHRRLPMTRIPYLASPAAGPDAAPFGGAEPLFALRQCTCEATPRRLFNPLRRPYGNPAAPCRGNDGLRVGMLARRSERSSGLQCVVGNLCAVELLRATERADSTSNIKVIKELEGLKVSARDRMQDFDAYMNPTTHQMQQTIYMATYNDAPKEKDDIFKILAKLPPKEVEDPEASAACKLEAYDATPSY